MLRFNKFGKLTQTKNAASKCHRRMLMGMKAMAARSFGTGAVTNRAAWIGARPQTGSFDATADRSQELRPLPNCSLLFMDQKRASSLGLRLPHLSTIHAA